MDDDDNQRSHWCDWLFKGAKVSSEPDKIGVMGFCWGGGKTLLFTTRSKDLAASVVYYGPIPANLDDLKTLRLRFWAITANWINPSRLRCPRLEEAMKKYGKSFEYKIYR